MSLSNVYAENLNFLTPKNFFSSPTNTLNKTKDIIDIAISEI